MFSVILWRSQNILATNDMLIRPLMATDVPAVAALLRELAREYIVHESPPHPLNVPGFAMSALVRWLRQRMGIALPRFSLVVDSLPVKGVLGVLSLLFRPRLRRADCREHGHTVTAIYRKRSHPAA